MGKDKQRKLRLVRETLRRLDPVSLSKVVGGTYQMDMIAEPSDPEDAGSIPMTGTISGIDKTTRGTRPQ